MNFTPSSTRRRPTLRALELTSMIDVIFLLLIYFILTTTTQPPETEIASSLESDRSTASAADLVPQVIEAALVDGRPTYSVGSRVARSRAELTQILSTLSSVQGVVIRASGALTAQDAAAVLQAARDAGFTKVTYVPTP